MQSTDQLIKLSSSILQNARNSVQKTATQYSSFSHNLHIT